MKSSVFDTVESYAAAVMILVFGLIANGAPAQGRERICINEGWRFMRYRGEPDSLCYDVRPRVANRNDNKVADTRAAELAVGTVSEGALKKWILPSANDFINDPARRHRRPSGNPGSDFPFVQGNFDDRRWQSVTLPHDWAIDGPFYKDEQAVVGGGMGRLPVQGVAWYRRKLDIPATDVGRSIYLEIDGALSYAMVWLNGKLVGGWPYGYNSFRLDLSPYVHPGGDNQLAIRVDNPNYSSRWYPGAGLYRNVWLVKVGSVQVGQWGTRVRTREVSRRAATIDLGVQVENKSVVDEPVRVVTEVFAAGDRSRVAGGAVTGATVTGMVKAGEKKQFDNSMIVHDPLLWGPVPSQKPNMYVAVTTLYRGGEPVDRYETRFGIRAITFDPVKGVLVNGEAIRVQGVNQHHDLGALGAAFNVRAAERQLELLREMGCNAIRLAHNPPAPELLDLTDRMGFLVVDEIFDCWEKGKNPYDFHLIFNDWHEADVRSFIRRDRNHPSIMAWSFGNEVGEQYTADSGAVLARQLYEIVREEDSTRPATASMNYAKPDMPFPAVMDILSLNYQGEGIRDAPAYSSLRGIRTAPLYSAFQKKFPGKMIVSSETASTLSTRGTYVFPVSDGISAPVSDSAGGDSIHRYVSAYDLYTAAFGASPDKVFSAQDRNPYVAGEFVWTGWDYIGEPTPYYTARSSYSGIIDLAGFKKDRFYLYQSRWRPALPMAHILPHWNWPGRMGMITPVHVFTSGDSAELFLNGKSLGGKRKGPFEYRLRWDEVRYVPGELKVVAYKQGKKWAEDVVRTTGEANRLQLSASADDTVVRADGQDLVFVTVRVSDRDGLTVPESGRRVRFEISGPGEIVATDNGDPADLESFGSLERAAFGGMALVIVRPRKNMPGVIKVRAISDGLAPAEIRVTTTMSKRTYRLPGGAVR